MSNNEVTPIRVLHVVGNMGAGGLETMIMNWYRKIDRCVIQFDFLVHHKEKAFYEDEIISLGGKVFHSTVLDDKNFLKYKKFLNNFFKNNKEYDIVHGHHSNLGMFYLKAAKKYGVKIRISHSHTSSYSKSLRGLVSYLFSRRYGSYANYHFACSEVAGRYMYGSKYKYEIINNGIDTKKFSFSLTKRKQIRSNLCIQDKKVIIHVGRFYDVKNHTFLIDVFNKINKEADNRFVLLLIGTGPLKNTIEKKVNALGLSDKVFFMGNISNVCDFLSAADIFVFPSLYEGLPLTLVEAQANGLPVICSDSITKETMLTDHYFPLSLRSGVDFWASHIINLSLANTPRDYAYLTIKEKGFDSSDVVNRITIFYLKTRSF